MILLKTEAGQRVFKDRSIRLTPRQRSAFILFDGQRSVDDVLGAGMGIAREDIEQMVELGLLGQPGAAVAAPRDAAAAAVAPAPVAPVDAARSPQQRYQDAYPVATQLTGALGLRGFRLNLAVEGTASYEELLALAPKIRAAVGPDKAEMLDRALGLGVDS
ncbi:MULTISPECIES: hypothetical protein [unclassified Variovorax]|uniref:hypothetical protein n=1 Tax=unclassified Variovorax TaxID=663243 RepID=UPI0025755BA8|nr:MULTISPECIES: hypothetical protein [unclassified Variovorax]MDM0091800.1 hypothetical protein [Variovorax sp. J22G40]MDM0147698.1 hypothetical protein [Variovorax sp. J2P1-31]